MSTMRRLATVLLVLLLTLGAACAAHARRNCWICGNATCTTKLQGKICCHILWRKCAGNLACTCNLFACNSPGLPCTTCSRRTGLECYDPDKGYTAECGCAYCCPKGAGNCITGATCRATCTNRCNARQPNCGGDEPAPCGTCCCNQCNEDPACPGSLYYCKKQYGRCICPGCC